MLITQWKKIVAALLLVAVSGTVIAKEHSHSHDHEKQAKLTLDSGKKWATDDNLRQAMEHIRDALAAELRAIYSGKTTAEQYRALAQKTNDQITFIVKNCKPEQKADAMLHLILADIIAGADAMARQSGEAARGGAEKIAGALENYGAYFDHPNWHRVKHAH